MGQGKMMTDLGRHQGNPRQVGPIPKRAVRMTTTLSLKNSSSV